ncbi:hypothetical protein RMO66_10450 [Nocardia seriolae]|nr:hypothetical protein [Nocardia seriolae]WNJ61074.1 hypothetical protein RMO66_10450 [Nocardia seriolae]
MLKRSVTVVAAAVLVSSLGAAQATVGTGAAAAAPSGGYQEL